MFKFNRILSVFLIVCCLCSFGVYGMGNTVIAFAEDAPNPSGESDPPSDSDSPVRNAKSSGTADIFWDRMDRRFNHAEEGDTVEIPAERRTSMPFWVFRTMKQQGCDVLITWDGGEDIFISVDNIPDYDKTKVSFDFTELQEMLKASE